MLSSVQTANPIRFMRTSLGRCSSTPPLQIIEIPETCPELVAEALQRSFRVFWCDPSAAANHLRTAVEELLTAIGVKRYTNKGGKKHLISLHARIGLLPAKYSQLQGLLLAIKWLGNAASHATQISMDDAMDAYELMEFAMQEMYSEKSKKILALAAMVNKKKGPIKKPKKTRKK